MLEGHGGGFLPPPGRSGGNKLRLPPASGNRSTTGTREDSDSRPPKPRKFHAGAKIVGGLPSRAPSSHALQPQRGMRPHTKLPTWVELWTHRTAEAKASITLSLSEPRGKRHPSPSQGLNTWTDPAVNFNHGIRNRNPTFVIVGQALN